MWLREIALKTSGTRKPLKLRSHCYDIFRFRNLSTRLTIPSPNHRENGDAKKMLGAPNGDFGEDQTLTIVDSEGAEEQSKANGVPNKFPHGTKPKIILHSQVGKQSKL